MNIGVFGFAQPLGVFAALGLAPQDVTTDAAPPMPQVDRFIEPFMDPFARSLLRRLAAGALDPLDLLIFLRESPGGLPAFHYACEFRRRALLPETAPALFLLNLLPSNDPAARTFNLTELDRLRAAFTAQRVAVPPVPDARSEQIKAAENCANAPRLALLGAPLGNRALHDLLTQTGQIVMDQQRLAQPDASGIRDLDHALQIQAMNPYAARQPRDIYIVALDRDIARNQVDRVIWQVDPHDDLWGWLAPRVRALCTARGVGFTDLGALPRWPNAKDIAVCAQRIAAS